MATESEIVEFNNLSVAANRGEGKIVWADIGHTTRYDTNKQEGEESIQRRYDFVSSFSFRLDEEVNI